MALPRTHAFTLVELSIVLVILGLLTGGILTGQSLIRAAELRSVVTEFQRYQAAVQSFRDKYRALPGDLPNARAFWGSGAAATNTCEVPAGAPAHYDTCNGSGDGRVGYASYSTFYGTEVQQFWRHLALAGLIEGEFSGQNDLGSGFTTTPAQNKRCDAFLYDTETTPSTPSSRFSDLRWFTGYNPHCVSWPSANSTFDYGASPSVASYGHYFILGRFAYSGVNPTFQSVMKPEEVWNIDSKIDDGKPGIGKVIGYPYTCTTAVNITQGSTAEYLLSSTTGQCGVVFANAY